MAILNYTTQIKAEKSIMEIQQVLVKHGASKIVIDYEGQNPKAVTFCLVMNNNLIAYSLPANYSGVLKAMKKDLKIPRKYITEEQAIRISWRIIKDWVQAQMALVQAELADVSEVFLPYAITKNGSTLYNEIMKHELLAINS